MLRREFFLTAAASAAAVSAQEAPAIVAERDIPYAKVSGNDLLLDVYRPARPKAEKLPLLVWIHGGAWRNGSKQDGRQVAPFVLTGEYVGASINYRLSGEATFPAQIHDCKAAIRWLRAHAEEFGVDDRRVGVWGSSAGGHLAALLGTSGGAPELEGDVGGNLAYSSRVQAVCDFFGPTDFLQMDAHSTNHKLIHDAADSPESQLIGGPIQKNPEKVARANPITYVTPDDPPFLIVHGDQDPLVPYNQSELLHAALDQAGVPTELHKVVRGGHGRGGEFGSPELQQRVANFFELRLGI